MLSDTLVFKADDVEYVYDTLDTNAINFRSSSGYFSIQTGVYLEEDDRLNEPFLELNSQAQSQSGGLAGVLFQDACVTLSFQAARPFLRRYTTVQVDLPMAVPRQLVDFFNNHLFLADVVAYDSHFDSARMVPGTARRDFL